MIAGLPMIVEAIRDWIAFLIVKREGGGFYAYRTIL